MNVAVVLAVLAGAAAAESEPLAWPLDLPRELSSSFAEYRPGRFHAGIDLRTAGTGREVRAAEVGYISRVRCSPWGYGRAIYLHLDTGYSVVYAHLQDYYDELTAYVRAAQHANESYSVDLYPEPNQFRVARGQIIALSGQTGIGAPHLHFEIRDKDQQPVQPRLVGMHWPDTTPPKLLRVLAVPRDTNARVDGDLVPATRVLRETAPGQYICDPLPAAGQLGFGIDYYDPGSGAIKFGAYRLELRDGDETRFMVRHDALSYADMANAAVAYHPYFHEAGRYLLLWRWPGNVCASYAHSLGDGWLDTAGRDAVRILVADSAGNEATVTVPLRPLAAPEPPAEGVATRGTVEMDCFANDLSFTARFDGAETITPELSAMRDDGDMALFPFERVGEALFRVRWEPVRSGRYVFSVNHPRVEAKPNIVHAFLRGEGGNATIEGLGLAVPADAPYGVLFVTAEVNETAVAAPIPHAGPAYRIGPEGSPLNAPVRIGFPIPPDALNPGRLHVYRRGSSSWSFQSTQREGSHLVIRASSFGDFALLDDNRAPVFANVLPAEGYRATTRRPYIRADVTDVGSGVARFEARCDGEWLLTSYDPERTRIEWIRDEELPPGEHEVTLSAWDEAGNRTTVARQVVIPE